MSYDENQGAYGLIVSFPDGSPSFVNGFSAGMIWQKMQSGQEFLETTLTENTEVLQRMCIATGYEVEIKDTEFKEWKFSTFKKVKEPTITNPFGLRVVK